VAVVTTPEIAGKRLALLKEAARRLSRVVVLFNSDDPTNVEELAQAEVAARALGVELRKVDVRGRNPVRTVAAALDKRRVDGLMVIYSIDTHEHRAAIAEEATKRRLPAIGAESFAAAGGLLSYGTEAYATWRRAAEYVSKILRGATPGELPIEQESRVLLVVNLRTAKRLNLAMPMSLTLQADEIIR
jgi:putative ABC transport system substrate-binding protein